MVGEPPAFAMGKMPSDVIRDQLQEYKNTLLAYFRAFNLLPILLPADQQPGDVFDMRQMGILRARGRECFPGLAEPAPVSSALTYTFELDAGKLGLALGLERMLSLNVDSGFERATVVNYTDVKVSAVSQQALTLAVSEGCPDVQQVVTQSIVPVESSKAPPLLAIVGTLVAAKRQVFLAAKSNVDVKSAAERITAMLGGTGVGGVLRAVGVDPTISMTIGFSSKRGVIIQSDQLLPIAFAPAFLPDLLFSRAVGLNADPGAPIAMEWRAFDPHSVEDTARLRSLIDAARR